jgi:hypothetical protein
METMRKINLINGEFSSSDAREIVMDLYHKNINFNKIQNFSSQVRYGEDDLLALARIEDLKDSVEQITEILMEAKNENKRLVIKSYLEIELEDRY